MGNIVFYTITAISLIVVKIPDITEMGQDHKEEDDHNLADGGGGPGYDEMEDCFYNQTGEWCPKHIHQAIEVTWLIIMDILSSCLLFILFKNRESLTGLPLG